MALIPPSTPRAQTEPPAPAAASAQAPTSSTPPVAIVALDQSVRGAALSAAGSMQAKNGRAFITGSGSITAGDTTAEVTLPYRGTLRVCSSTTVSLAADTSTPPGGLPGLLMAMDHGAVEMSFASTPRDANADTLITPDFRILISGPGTSEVKIRLGSQGDTCIDNGAEDNGSPSSAAKAGTGAPYVVVTSLFDAGAYRVQPGQRVTLQHGSLNEVVDKEKEPCGCPPPPSKTNGNEFPLAQSEGLAPQPPVPPPSSTNQAALQPVGNVVPPLVYSGEQKQEPQAIAPTALMPPATTPAPAQQPPAAANKKPGVFARLGHFFRRVFGAE